MLSVNPVELIIQILTAFFCCLLFRCIGFIFRQPEEEKYAQSFYSLLTGMIVVVVVYSIIITGFKTIFILLLPGLIFCFKWKPVFKKIEGRQLAELLLLSTGFVLIYNFLPESEYKQKDSFFYLQISEALNLTGQENISNYNNVLSDKYHGVEAYHYFELWLNAFLLKITGAFLPGIQVLRIITYTIISVTFIYGLFCLWEKIAGVRPTILAKVVCLAFVFFMPDLYAVVPEFIQRYLVFNFENNFLERPNFRLIYLFLVPVIASFLTKSFDNRCLFFVVCLCLVNPTVFVTVVPAIFLLHIASSISKFNFISTKSILLFSVFILLYALFYIILGVKGAPAVYASGWRQAMNYYSLSYKFVGLTIVTSLIYIFLLLSLAWLFLKLFNKEPFVLISVNKLVFYFLLLLIICGIFVGRMLGFVDNLYQVAYNSYIVSVFVIFILFVFIAKRSAVHALFVITVFTSGYILSKSIGSHSSQENIFLQNGKFSYDGKHYSEKYLESVLTFAKTKRGLRGAYIADSLYYKDLYYSARNPNVYHLPIIYIIASRFSVVDFCLSDDMDITYDLPPNRYLDNAISRSYYHQQYHPDQVGLFCEKQQIQFLVLTPGATLGREKMVIKQTITDENTGERFLILEE